jgi:hypothetical protein
VKDKNNLNFDYFQAFLVVLCAFVFVSALPADEAIIGDNIEALSPSDDSELLKPLLIKKKLLLLKKKKLIIG